MSGVLLLGVVKPDYWKDDKNLFRNVREVLRFKNWVYYSESEKHTLVFFVFGEGLSLKNYMKQFDEIYSGVDGLKSEFKFHFDLNVYLGGIDVK